MSAPPYARAMAGQDRGGGINGGVIAATTWIDGMTDVLQVMLLLATLIWTVVKIAQAIKDFHD